MMFMFFPVVDETRLLKPAKAPSWNPPPRPPIGCWKPQWWSGDAVAPAVRAQTEAWQKTIGKP
jgi:hypothetical protein